MLKLIVNADDFGLTEKVNEGILKCFSNGILRSTSLMANGQSFEHAIGIIRSNPKLDIGVHLTLVEEKPVLDAAKLPSLVGENGQFHKHATNFTKKYYSDKISFDEARNELNAQFEKVLDHGVKVSHIDSHQHLHMLPKILDITIGLAHRYKVKFIRFPREKFSSYMFLDLKSLSRIMQMIAVNRFCSVARNRIPLKTDHFAGFYFGGKLSKQNLLTLINNLPMVGVCELMCHPGMSEDLTNYTHWKYRQVEEMLALVDTEVATVIIKKNIEISSFKNLSE